MITDSIKKELAITIGNSMKVQYIQTLVAIADAGSLRAASEKLGKSQPALTKTLRQAEEDLGASIFQRSSRGVVLTALGERVLARARTITSEIVRLDDEVAQLRGEQVGGLNICVSPLAATMIVPQAIARFHKAYPKIEVHLTSGLFPNALKPLRDGQTDMVIGPLPPVEMTRDISVEALWETPIVLITARKSQHAKAQCLGDLTHAPWIMIGGPGGPGDFFRKHFVDRGLTPPHATTTSESYFGAMSLVETLGAVCTFPLRLLEHVQQGWDVVQIDIQEQLGPQKIALMKRSGHPLTPIGEALANAVRRRATTLRHDDKV